VYQDYLKKKECDMTTIRWTMVVAGLAVAGCGGSSSDKPAPAAEGGSMQGSGQDSGGMGMDGMHQGMEGMKMEGMPMMGMMRAHMDSMGRMSPERMRAMMARHQDMASRMMDGIGTDMRGMKMTPDAGWTALSDSVRQDLAELPALSGKALEARVKGHVDRMRRLMARHEAMMKE